jgi:NAD(P)-dependent dehydrogenase (short-subunit alcohol dehydrogenase family)
VTEVAEAEDIGGTAVVTGARGGIGRAVVTGLARRGAHVVAVDAEPPAGSRPGVTDIVGDVTDEATLAAAFGAAPATADRPVTSLVTCAFAEERAPIKDATRDGFTRTLDVLLTACWQWGTALRGRAAGRPAAIVHVSSVQAFGAVAGSGPYAAAKAGLLALTRAMAVEWGPDGIRCNAVAPAFVPVPRNAATWRDERRLAAIEARYPLRRAPRAEDVAAAVCFLLSPDARAITGVCLPVDGGLLAALP